MKGPDIAKVRALREQGYSISEAITIVKGELLRKQLADADSIDDLRRVLEQVLEQLWPERGK